MKLKLLALCLLVSTYALAQDTPPQTLADNLNSGFKANAKNWTAEVNFRPFGNQPISISYLRFRHFISAKNALRIGFTYSNRTDKPVDGVTQSLSNFGVRPGYEWHFAGTDRLSPYVGGEAIFSTQSASFQDTRAGAPVTSVEGASDQNGGNRGFTSIGVNAVAGVDFYVVKKLYLGFEIGYGFESITTDDVKTTFSTGSSVTVEGGKISNLAFNYVSALRLGFVF